MVRIRGTTALALAFLTAIAWAFNVTKPVHVDDTAYLKMAEHIAREPSRPRAPRHSTAIERSC